MSEASIERKPSSFLERCKKRSLPLWTLWAPIFFTILLYPFSHEMDLSLAAFSFNEEAHSFCPPSWCTLVYVWGIVPGQILFACATLCVLAGLFSHTFRNSRIWKSSLYLFFVLSLGSGLIAHGIFKEHFTRPRPKQIQEFGGKYPYLEPLMRYNRTHIPPQERLRSMPSGHATMGFYFLAFWFLGHRFSSRFLSWFGVMLGISLGVLLSISRVLEGGHFISDGLAAFIIMWYTALILDLIWKRSYE